VSVPIRTPQQSLINASVVALRQQMEDSNHERVNMVTQQIGTIINPLIRDTNNSYQAMSTQMERISNFFGAPPARNIPVPQNLNARPIETPTDGQVNQVLENMAQ